MKKTQKIDFILYLKNGSEKKLPVKWCICGQCDGDGNSSAYLGAFTSDDMRDMDDDFMDDYFAGNYDRPCDHCGGTGKVQDVDEAMMSKSDLEMWHKQCWESRKAELENLAEIRAGA